MREISERSVHPPVRKRIFHQGSNQPNILQRSKNERDFGLSRVTEAIDQNLLAFVLILGSFLVAIVWLFKGPNFRANFKWVKVLTCVTVFTGLFWLARMIPWQIGEWLISGTYH